MTTKKGKNCRSGEEVLGTIRRRKKLSQRRRDGLIRHAFDRTSQSGEDGIIQRLFELIPPPPVGHNNGDGNDERSGHSDEEVSSTLKKKRWCVDVGAWDGKHLSNTYSLLVPAKAPTSSEEGDGETDTDTGKGSSGGDWRGVLIEADPEKCKALHSLHDPLGNVCIECAVSCLSHSNHSLYNIITRLSSNTEESLPNASAASHLPTDFDFLCIDVDGADYWLLQDLLTDRTNQTVFRPKVICIEFNPTIPHDIIYIQPRDDSIRHGSSLAALVELAESYDYQLVETTCYNAFFVHAPIYNRFVQSHIPFDPVIETVHEITMGTNLYQLYDGTLKLAGCQKLLWHRMPILEKNIQVLDRAEERLFPFAPSNEQHPSRLPTTDDRQFHNSHKQGNRKHDSNQPAPPPLSKEEQEQELHLHTIAVDMSPYCQPPPTPISSHQTTATESPDTSPCNQSARILCSQQILNNLQKDGFALVRGTGMSRQICTEALRWTHELLQKASEDVRKSGLSSQDRARRGYSPPNSENFASLLGEEGPNDLVRKFRVGPCCDEDGGDGDDDGGAKTSENKKVNVDIIESADRVEEVVPSSSSSLLKPNTWPSEETWGKTNATAFKTSVQSYYDDMSKVANAILEAICDAIDGCITNNQATSLVLKPTAKKDASSSSLSSVRSLSQSQNSSSHTSILTLLGYRKGKRHRGKRSRPLVAAHTDVGVVTVLLFDGGDSAMLQRASSIPSQDWVNVTLPRNVPVDPIFVINVGDCLSDLSGRILPSTLHRVVPQDGTRPRNCLAFFVGLDPEKMLVLPEGETVRYEEWRRRRIAKAAEVLDK